MRRILFVTALAFAGGCYGQAGYSGEVAYSSGTPDLVEVQPGVSVIADYDEPIFYADGFYWWNYGGGWYRSSYYTGGWAVAAPPVAVVRIGNAGSYRHYRGNGRYVARHRPVPSHRIQRPVVRDHRADRRDNRRR